MAEHGNGGLSTEAIRNGLTTRYVGHSIYYWSTIGSTNDELKQLAQEEGAPEGTLAIADDQSAGRGRLDRKWMAPAGSSLLMSLLFRPAFLDPAHAQQLTMICSLAAADAVSEVTGLQPDLKWPNDLLLQGKKLAGVLTELGFGEEDTLTSHPDEASGSPSTDVSPSSWVGLAWVVVGMGLNINLDFTDWPDLADTATSLSLALGRPVSRLPLLHRWLAGVEDRYDALRAGQSPHHEWAARLATVGQSVTVTAPDGVHRGIAEGVDEAGALLLRQPDSQVKRILAGDVTLRRGRR